MKYLLEKLIDHISQSGEGPSEFDNRDIEYLIRRVQKLEEKKNDRLKYLAKHNQGIGFHRIFENDRGDFNVTEKAFFEAWEPEAKLLEGLLRNPNSGLEIKPSPKVKVAAATLIQWLGTNIGMAFLERALEKSGFKIVKIENP